MIGTTIIHLPLVNLIFILLPVLVVIWVMWLWSCRAHQMFYALVRMFIQLLAIGYVLVFLFALNDAYLVFLVLSFMVLVASWIALGVVKEKRKSLYLNALISIAVGGGVVFILVIKGVLQLEHWYEPQYAIPLAGMIFANAMTSISLAIERLEVELKRGVHYTQARQVALSTALIPIINTLFAVGLVALPGMMTGQILSGIEPLIAVRYQIMVMLMILGATGLSTILFLLNPSYFASFQQQKL